MNIYRVLGRISHNGTRYFPDDEIELSEEEAEALSAAIDLSSKSPKKASKASKVSLEKDESPK
jgi:hypothetical protein